MMVKKLIWQAFRYVPLTLRRRILFLKNQKKLLNLRDPRTFNEKVNWRIINDRREILEWTCDKMEMKTNASLLSEDVLIPKTLWAGTDIAELIDFNFPSRWILKANHRSQCVYIGQGTPNFETLAGATRGWLDRVQENDLGEWAYSKAVPSILVEEWIGEQDKVPEDYKFFVFGGRVEMIQVDSDRFTEHKIALYDREWQRINVSKNLWSKSDEIKRPNALEQMVNIAEEIAKDFDFMRIDLFATNAGIYFGETTPYPGGGLSPFDPVDYDRHLGDLWKLPK